MNQVITAVFEAGKLRPEIPLLDSGKFLIWESGENKIGHWIPKSAVMSETG